MGNEAVIKIKREDFSNTYAPNGVRLDDTGLKYIPDIVSDCVKIEDAVKEAIMLINYKGAEYGYMDIFFYGGTVVIHNTDTYETVKSKYKK